MKNSYYFPHDYHARNDPKLTRLRVELGPVTDGVYWCIVEMLYEEGGRLPIADLEIIAKTLYTTRDIVEKVVVNSNLFIENDGFFYSESLLKRLKHIDAKRRKAKGSANRRWSANAMRTHSERNAIKESKVKESKVNKNNTHCAFDFDAIWSKYPKQVGKKAALRHFSLSVKSDKDYADIQSALENYKKSDTVMRGFVQNGSTWLNNWRDWIVNPVAPKPIITFRED